MSEPLRLQRYLAQAGVAARRKAEELITAGRVSVNGKIVRVLGTKIDPSQDMVTVDGEAVAAKDHFYVLLNKPKGCITAVSDDRGRPTVMEFLPNTPVPVKPVGRLDFYSEGVLLLTNDGELAARLLAPQSHVEKTYHVKVHGKLTPDDLRALRDGIRLDDGQVTLPAEVNVLPGESRHTWLGITIHEGKHRQIHRMIEALGYRVDKLQRVAFGNLTFHDLRIGDARELHQLELNALRDLVQLPHDEVARGRWRSSREDTDMPRRAKQKVRDEKEEAALLAAGGGGAVHESDFEGEDGGDRRPAPVARRDDERPRRDDDRRPRRPEDRRPRSAGLRNDGPRAYRGGQRTDGGARTDGGGFGGGSRTGSGSGSRTGSGSGSRTGSGSRSGSGSRTGSRSRSGGGFSDGPRGGGRSDTRSAGGFGDGPRGGGRSDTRSAGRGGFSDGPRGGGRSDTRNAGRAGGGDKPRWPRGGGGGDAPRADKARWPRGGDSDSGPRGGGDGPRTDKARWPREGGGGGPRGGGGDAPRGGTDKPRWPRGGAPASGARSTTRSSAPRSSAPRGGGGRTERAAPAASGFGQRKPAKRGARR